MIACVLALLLAPAAPGGGLPPLIPRERFFDNPEKENARLSPDGKQLAYLAAEGGKLNVFVRTLGKKDDRAVTHDHARGIWEYFWSADGKNILYMQDAGGDENFHVFAADATHPEKPARDLTPFPKVRAEMIAVPKKTPRFLLVALNKRNAEEFDAYRLNIATGEAELLAENPGKVQSWHADAQGKLRAYLQITEDAGRELFVRDTEKSPWRSAIRYTIDEIPDPIGFSADGKNFHLGSSKGSNFKRLVRLDLESGQEKVLDEDAESDLAYAVVSEKTQEVLAAVYNRERFVMHFLDKRLEKDFAALNAGDRGDKWLGNFDAAENKFVVWSNDDVDPGSTYLFDRKTGKAELLFKSRPWLDAAQLAKTQPITILTRDQLTIRGYLTLPNGVPAQNLPMVLNVHGGPWHRDSWGFNSEVQFLANRGYAVLQVNYRGSTGYGRTFAQMANKQFARKMHDDLIDAANHVVQKKIADPKRIGIYGGSYGGYATLVGLTFTPDFFAAGVDNCGPSSLITLIRSFPPYWKPFLKGRWYRYVGNPDEPGVEEDLKSRSPLYHVEKIKKPLFIAQGANDVRVTKAESDQLVDALKKAGKEVEYMVAGDEGHGFANPENQIEFYRRMEAFLAKHLGGRKQDG